MNYVGEHLLLGQLGHLSVILSFVAALVAALSFAISTQKRDTLEESSWLNLGKWSFYAHAIAVFGIVGTLFYIIAGHYFEYYYAWRHSSVDLPTRYLFSSFWEGQEGSFLLWMTWHAVLGLALIFTAKKWTAPVMATVSLVQVFLASMLLGIYVLGYKIGSSPFVLLRNAMPEAPIFQMPNYLDFVADGNGLNPLLQNYWMTIHPPTLFLGFAATVIPFAFAIAGIWMKKYTEWVRPALPWALFAVVVLGTGVMMGAAWAYEALNFGGYWAWDPVENVSLVPWLMLIAGVHTMVAFKHTGHALRASFLFILLSFILILYATFLTRSGVLGETSVHAFTDLGLSGQLLVFIFAFLILAIYLLVRYWKKIPAPDREEELYSREFWLFVGAIVFVVSSLHIITVTSIPVINKVVGSNLAPPTDPIAHYNKWQMPIAIIIALLTATGQFFRYKNTDINKFGKKIVVSLIIAAVLAGLAAYGLKITAWYYVVFLFAAIFTVVANFDYLVRVLSGKIRVAGASVAHMGFGLMLLGILISSTKQHVISHNTLGIDYGSSFKEKDKRENLLLYRDRPMMMSNYVVTYLGDSTVGADTYFAVNYKKLEPGTNEVEEDFTLYPSAQVNPDMGLVASPDTRHYLTKDIYTHVTSIPDKSQQAKPGEPKLYEIGVGDTLFTSASYIVLEKLNPAARHPEYERQKGDIAVGAALKVHTLDTSYFAEPVYLIRENKATGLPVEVADLGLKIDFKSIRPQDEKIEIALTEQKPAPDYIIMKAIVFPYINLLWLGLVLMIVGFVMSIVRRVREKPTK